MGFFKRKRSPIYEQTYTEELKKQRKLLDLQKIEGIKTKARERAREQVQRERTPKSLRCISAIGTGLRRFDKACDKYGFFPVDKKKKRR